MNVCNVWSGQNLNPDLAQNITFATRPCNKTMHVQNACANARMPKFKADAYKIDVVTVVDEHEIVPATW